MVHKKAFTITELLVVLSIVPLLMAILLPALGNAREQGRVIVCRGNLRQMCIAAQAYIEVYDGYYPIAQYRQDTESVRFRYSWDFTTIKDKTTNEIKVVPGLLWQGQMVKKIQQCPSFRGDSGTECDPYSGYNYNTSYIGHGQGERIETPAKTAAVKRPAQCALFGDGQWAGGADKFMRAPRISSGEFDYSLKAAGTQGYRHAGMTNIAWCDGHTGSQKELYSETAPTEKEKIERYNSTSEIKIGFLSPDNSMYDLE